MQTQSREQLSWWDRKVQWSCYATTKVEAEEQEKLVIGPLTEETRTWLAKGRNQNQPRLIGSLTFLNTTEAAAEVERPKPTSLPNPRTRRLCPEPSDLELGIPRGEDWHWPRGKKVCHGSVPHLNSHWVTPGWNNHSEGECDPDMTKHDMTAGLNTLSLPRKSLVQIW